MRAYRHRLVAILLAVAVAGAAVEASVAPPGFAGPVLEPLEELPVAPGVRLQTYAFTGDAGVSRVYVLSAKLRGAPVRIRTTSPGPGGGVLGLASVPVQASSVPVEARWTVVGAVNGDFWTGPPLAGVPYHLQIREGELLSSPQPVGAAWGLTSEGQMLLEPVRMDAVIWTAGGSRSRLLAVNKPRGPQALVLYSPSWAASTRTGPGGTEAVIAALTPPLPLRAGVTYAGTVSAVVEGPGDTAIPPGSLVLSGAGEAAQWMARVLRPGTAVRLRIDLWGESGRTWNDVIEAIGGGPGSLLRNGRPDPGLPSVEGVHPRTALGVRGDELLLVAVDGRQPPYSTGVTLEELAWILRGLGATDGLNLDGGGSTTLLARLPGEPGLRLVNRPSDGSERAVGNALAVVSTAAPTGVLHHVFLRPSRLVLLQGSAWPLRVLGADDVLAPVAVDPGTVRWAVEGGVAEVDAAGRLRARRPGEGWVVASAGGVTARVPVRVVGAPDRVQIEPDPVVVDRGGAAEFVVRAWHEGQELLVSPELFDCRISGVAGTRIEGHDLVRAGPSAGGEGLLTCGRPGLAPASARLVVGKPPVLLEGFEGPWRVQALAVRARASVRVAQRPLPVRLGTYSLELAYDFTAGPAGTRAAYVVWPDGLPLDGRPRSLGLWVYGDGGRHWLRATLYDALRRDGPGITVDFTPKDGLDWVGWRHVQAPIPPDVRPPVTVRRIYVVETDASRGGRGTLYFDHLRALYSDTGEDLEGPVVVPRTPPPGARVASAMPEIAVQIHDRGAGVQPAAILAMLDGRPVPVRWDEGSGRATLVLAAPLAPGLHHVKVEAADRAGNPSQPWAEWSFTVEAAPGPAPGAPGRAID